MKDLNKLTNKFLTETNDNIIGVGIGRKIKGGFLTNDIGVIYTVKKKLPLTKIKKADRIPETIKYEGKTYITDVIEGEATPLYSFCYDEFYTWLPQNSSHVDPSNANKIRPLKGGVSTTNNTNLTTSSGTLGFLAVDNEDNTLVGVTNNHVIIKDGFLAPYRGSSVVSNTKDNIVMEPSNMDLTGGTAADHYIGVVKRFKPWLSGITTNFVDAALCTIDEAVIDADESWKIEGMTGITSGMLFASKAEIDDILYQDYNLYLAGRSTGAKGEGRTKMKMASLFYSLQMYYGYGYTINYNDLFTVVATDGLGGLCYEPLWSGDSGSPVYADVSGGNKKIIGLLFGGLTSGTVVEPWSGTTIAAYTTAICCRIDRIVEALNISPWTGQTVGYSDKNNIEEYVLEGLSNVESITIGGKKYFLSGLISQTGNTTTTTTIAPTTTTTTTASSVTTTTTTGTATLSCSATNIFEYAHSSIVDDSGAMYLGERKQNPYIIRFPDPDDLSDYTRVALSDVGNEYLGLENVCKYGNKLYFGTLETTTGDLVVVEVDTNSELTYTKHTITGLNVWNFAITTDGTYIYGGSDYVFFRIRMSDWEVDQQTTFYTDFTNTHAACYSASRNEVYFTTQGTTEKLAIVDAENIWSYTTIDLSSYTNTLTDDMVYYNNKLYIGSEVGSGVIVDLANNNSLSSLDIMSSYGLFITGTTIYNAAIDGYIQKFSVSTPTNIQTYKLEADFIPNEILLNGSRVFITKWAGPSVAKMCEMTI